MTLGIRKTIVLVLVAAVFLLANMWLVMNWLEDKGVIDLAKYVRTEYLTGTAITIIVALLILLVKPVRPENSVVLITQGFMDLEQRRLVIYDFPQGRLSTAWTASCYWATGRYPARNGSATCSEATEERQHGPGCNMEPQPPCCIAR